MARGTDEAWRRCMATRQALNLCTGAHAVLDRAVLPALARIRKEPLVRAFVAGDTSRRFLAPKDFALPAVVAPLRAVVEKSHIRDPSCEEVYRLAGIHCASDAEVSASQLKMRPRPIVLSRGRGGLRRDRINFLRESESRRGNGPRV